MQTITVNTLSKSFGAITALRNLSFSVTDATMYGLIGPDGAGKSTFMRIATCLLLQNSGTVTIKGFDTLKDAHEVKRIIGYMPQRFSLYTDLTVKENLNFFADLFGVKKKERRQQIDKLLEFSQLRPFLSRRAGDLSGGMKQKLALSCMLIHTPDVLFLDEPTTGVDPVSRQEFWSLLNELRDSGSTIVVSTPYMDEAERLDCVGFILNGAIILEGSPRDLPQQYKYEIIAVRAPGLVKLSRKLSFPDYILNVQTFGDHLHLTVENAVDAIPVVNSFLKDNGIHSVSIERITPSMEDVFLEHMVNGH